MSNTYNSLKKIGYLIRFYRRQKDLSQMVFADELGISFRNLQRLEVGEVEPKLETLHRIATRMNIHVSSFIKPTDAQNLFIKDVSTVTEFESFIESCQKSSSKNEILNFSERLIQQDKQTDKMVLNLSAQIDGTRFILSEALAQLTGVTEIQSEIDKYIAFGSSLERWEYVFRSNMDKAVIQNFYFFPKGFKVFEEYHFNLKPNPDSPTSECYIRDITARHELETWLKLVHAGMLGY